MSGDLIDRIYEAAMLPHLWPTVLEDLSRVGNGHFAALFTASQLGVYAVSSTAGVQISEEYLAEGWPGRTDRLARLLAKRHAGFLGDLDVYTLEEMDREPVFTEFHRPRGLGWGTATAIPLPTGDMLIYDIERRFETGPVEAETIARLDELRPHLARAGLLSVRLAFERARAAAMVLDLLGLPAAVVGRNLRVMAANPRLEAMMPAIVQDRNERVTLTDRNADMLLGEALPRMMFADDPGGVRSFPIPASEGQPPTIVHLVPIRRTAQDVFAGALAILVLTPVLTAVVPDAEILQGLFDLTAAEARVARNVAEGQTIDAIADAFGVSRETIRSQLKAVLAKTGAGRQVDLAVLLSGTRIPGT